MSGFFLFVILVTFVIIPIPAGALLYLVTSNIFQIVQTFAINKQLELEDAKKAPNAYNVVDAKIIDAHVIDENNKK